MLKWRIAANTIVPMLQSAQSTMPPRRVRAWFVRYRPVMLLSVIITVSGWFIAIIYWPTLPPAVIRIGVLHSLTGTMSVSERALAFATVAMLEHINTDGGIRGRRLEPILADGGSDPAQFAAQAESLIREHQVQAIFGCWTSASRKAVKPIVEAHHNILFYPVQFEGFEQSDAIVYLGQTPNQQMKPAVKFALDHLGTRFYLLGSDYVFPRTANWYLRTLINLLGVPVVAEQYVPLGHRDFTAIIEDIRTHRPQVILNTLNGDSNLYFFAALAAAFPPNNQRPVIPVLSFSIGEHEITQIAQFAGAAAIVGHYASWNYFASLHNAANQHFTDILKQAGIATPTDPMSAVYSGIYLYKQAVEECESFEPARLKPCLVYQSFLGPAGIVTLEKDNLNAWQQARIGQVTPQLTFNIVWQSERRIPPQNFPFHCNSAALTPPVAAHNSSSTAEYEIHCAP